MSNILKVIAENSSPKSGITIIQIARKSGVSIASVKPLLQELEAAGEIRIREGINDKLIFKA